MSGRRPPATPPELPGYTYSRPLGSGGFSDVFLYNQLMPRRKVAVKVLRASPDADQAEFVDEANLMAHVSSHPAIVTIYHADVASDGRPFLVMEYCAGPNLAERYRAERLGVAETLRIGVRLAGAIETAHRAGILHRDIKPANVLTNDYGWPALTDFGISVMGSGAAEAETGMSIPWAAPEFFAEESPRDARADIYSLAATLHTVLAGRSPFEVTGGSNAAFDLISRIAREAPNAIGRADVPLSLENVLVRAMDKRPSRRYATALDFGRALQRVELELHLAPTPIDVPDVRRRTEPESSGVVFGETQVRPIIGTDPGPPAQGSWSPGHPFPSRPDSPAAAAFTATGSSTGPGATGFRVPRRPDDPAVWGPSASGVPGSGAPSPWARPTEQEIDPHEPAAPAKRGWLGYAVGGAVLALAVTSVVLVNLSDNAPDPTPTFATGSPNDLPTSGGSTVVPQPVNAQGSRDPDDPSIAVFTWEAPPEVPDAEFVYRIPNGEDKSLPAVSPLRLTNQDTMVCIALATRTQDSRMSEEFNVCS